MDKVFCVIEYIRNQCHSSDFDEPNKLVALYKSLEEANLHPGMNQEIVVGSPGSEYIVTLKVDILAIGQKFGYEVSWWK